MGRFLDFEDGKQQAHPGQGGAPAWKDLEQDNTGYHGKVDIEHNHPEYEEDPGLHAEDQSNREWEGDDVGCWGLQMKVRCLKALIS